MLIDEARERVRAKAVLNAFISVTAETGEGTVVAVKDLVDVAGVPTTGGGAILPLEPAAEDAALIRTLRQAGCVIVGKTNLHEWAYGITSTNPHHGAVRNPHDLSRVAGGSSGGSAVAAATGMCDWAVGSDTGGSIRIPASFCGVVGLKTTTGSIPMEGVIPLSRTLDTLGPLAQDVTATALALTQMTGTGPILAGPAARGSDLVLGVPRHWVRDLDAQTGRAWAQAGAALREVPFIDHASAYGAGATILLFEAAAFHRRWTEASPERYGPDVLALLRQGAEISEEAYARALRERETLAEAADAALEGVDALVLPATACVAPLIGEAGIRERVTRYTRPFNTTGQPAISIPFPGPGLPVGIQVVARRGRDRTLIEVAAALETDWRR